MSKLRVSAKGTRSGGQPFGRGALYALLANPIYRGEIRHRRLRHLGQHQAIVDPTVWDQVQARLRERAAQRRRLTPSPAASALTGKLFDEQGEPLYACGTHKGARRYRYFVSRKLIDGAERAKGGGWRLPAHQIERVAVAALRAVLRDRPALAAALQELSLPDLQAALEAAGRISAQLDTVAELGAVLGTFLERVQLASDGVRVTLSLLPLLAAPTAIEPARLLITHSVPLQMKRRGAELKLVIQSQAQAPSAPDPAMLKALVRAR
ncbi:MAG TPA: recombinase family protein, partial [Candidatus Binataceae bacterium]|nr:recombinase family protein [Candidatus Binataceae bacterium]